MRAFSRAYKAHLPCAPIKIPDDRGKTVTALGATTLPALAIERRRARSTSRAGEGASPKRPSRPVLNLATVDARTVRPEHNLRTWARAWRALEGTCEVRTRTVHPELNYLAVVAPQWYCGHFISATGAVTPHLDGTTRQGRNYGAPTKKSLRTWQQRQYDATITSAIGRNILD